MLADVGRWSIKSVLSQNSRRRTDSGFVGCDRGGSFGFVFKVIRLCEPLGDDDDAVIGCCVCVCV